MIRLVGLTVFYALASPIYAVIGVRKLVKLWRIGKTMRAGKITCVHCGTVNDLDVLARCGRCKTVEYGNRLRCTACGDVQKGFNCDNSECGVTIWVL